MRKPLFGIGIVLAIALGITWAWFNSPALQLKRHISVSLSRVKILQFVKTPGKDPEYYWHLSHTPEVFQSLLKGFSPCNVDVPLMKAIARDEFGERRANRFNKLYCKLEGRVSTYLLTDSVAEESYVVVYWN